MEVLDFNEGMDLTSLKEVGDLVAGFLSKMYASSSRYHGSDFYAKKETLDISLEKPDGWLYTMLKEKFGIEDLNLEDFEFEKERSCILNTKYASFIDVFKVEKLRVFLNEKYKNYKRMKKFIIAVDFDGVLAEINKDWKFGTPNYPGPLIEGADVYMQKLHEDGHQIIIWTARGGENLYLAERFIDEHNIPYDRINDNVLDYHNKFKHNNRKVYADIYIDDHQIGGIPSWKEMYDIIKKKSEK